MRRRPVPSAVDDMEQVVLRAAFAVGEEDPLAVVMHGRIADAALRVVDQQREFAGPQVQLAELAEFAVHRPAAVCGPVADVGVPVFVQDAPAAKTISSTSCIGPARNWVRRSAGFSPRACIAAIHDRAMPANMTTRLRQRIGGHIMVWSPAENLHPCLCWLSGGGLSSVRIKNHAQAPFLPFLIWCSRCDS